MSVEKKVRLACHDCDIDHFDGITEDELADLIAKGEWQDIEEQRTYEEACRTYGPDEQEPPGWSVLEWFTHIGLCPDCVAECADEQ
jgi:hypothetical protein